MDTDGAQILPAWDFENSYKQERLLNKPKSFYFRAF